MKPTKKHEVKALFNQLPLAYSEMMIDSYLFHLDFIDNMEASAVLRSIFKETNPLIIIGMNSITNNIYTRVDIYDVEKVRLAMRERINELLK